MNKKISLSPEVIRALEIANAECNECHGCDVIDTRNLPTVVNDDADIKNVLNTGTTVFAVEAFVVVEQIASALEENAKALKANANALNALVALINREKGITVDYEECY